MQNDDTSSRIYTLDVSYGIVKGLSVKTTLSFLDVIASNDVSGKVHEFGMGDIPVVASYLFQQDEIPAKWRLNVGLGVFVPTGKSFKNDIPSNPNFVSGTVDPLATAYWSYDIRAALGLFSHAFTRVVLDENKDKYRAGSTILYGAGARLRYFETFVIALGINVLHRFKDKENGEASAMTGGDWVFFSPTLSYLFATGTLSGFSMRISAQVPIYQRVNGMQLAEDFNIFTGVGYGLQLYN
ncbi:MAG: hypothetical protein QNJ97_15660 [Myxococcota bacterium]|nr:hypothetical protein [Myxococcota bacterium]